LTASCLAVTASARQASAWPAPAGSTEAGAVVDGAAAPSRWLASRDLRQSDQPRSRQDPAPGTQPPPEDPQPQDQTLPTSVDNVRDGLSREPVLRLSNQPIFRIGISERRPRYWDLQSDFLFPIEPRTSTTRWHDEFMAMTTPDEVRAFSPLNSGSGETLQLAATSLLFAGVAKLVQSGFGKWQDNRREGRAREAREEVDAALAAWEAANPHAVAPR
jgi:hypothetical protein